MADHAAERVQDPGTTFGGRKTYSYPRFESLGSPSAAGCVNLSSYSVVVDLSCSYIWRSAAFHRLVNCAVPLTPLILHALALRSANQTAVAILLPDYLAPLVSELFSSSRGLEVRRSSVQPVPCYAINSGATIFFENEALNTNIGASRDLAEPARLLNQAAQRVAGAPDGSGSYALLIVRDASVRRAFCDLPFVMDALRSVLKEATPPIALRAYWGNESVAETIRLFGRASVVIGYHGAGFSNVVFCRSGTVVLEWALWDKPIVSSSAGRAPMLLPLSYRNNIDTICHLLPGLICLPIGIAVEHSLPPGSAQTLERLIKNTSRSFAADVQDVRHPGNSFLHEARCLALDAGVLANGARMAARMASFAGLTQPRV